MSPYQLDLFYRIGWACPSIIFIYGNVILNDELYDRLLIESEEYADEYINRLDSHIEMHQLHKQYSAYAPNQFFIKIFDMLRRDGHVEV